MPSFIPAPIHKPPVAPRFSGGVSLSPFVKRLVTTLEKNAADMNAGKFAEDTLSSLGSRLVVSTSTAEKLEIAPTEFLESVAVYFGLSAMAKGIAKRFAKFAGMAQEHLLKPLDTLHPAELIAAIPARLATMLLPFGTMLLGVEGPLMYGKNIMTTRLFGKGSFEGMLGMGLTDDSAATIAETENKAKRRLKQCVVAVVSTLAAAMGLAKFGPSLLKRMAPEKLATLAKRLGGLDLFNHGGASPMLTKTLLGVYMGLSSLIYLDASRGGIERKEILPRFALIISYLLLFKDAMEKYLIFPRLKNVFNGLLTTIKNRHGVDETFATPLHTQVMRGQLVEGLLEKTAFKALDKAKQSKVLRAKMIGFAMPYIIGTGVVGFLNAAMNRYFTRERIAEQHQAIQQLVETKMKTFQASHLQGTYLSNTRSA